jgi:hypothetical protein
MPPSGISMTKIELIAHLAAVGNRIQGKEGPLSIQRIANYITECADEFNLSNEEQQLFLKFIASGSTDYKELLKGEANGNT